MNLNIKDPEAHQLAQALAKETGQSMTKAIVEALRAQLDQVRQRNRTGRRKEAALAIGRSCAKLLKRRPIDHDKLLYDDQGLPR